VYHHLLSAEIGYRLLMLLVAFYLKQVFHLWLRGEEDAIASSDITKAPFVKR
jgi:hypothetical protein